jgi:hypothetical protein
MKPGAGPTGQFFDPGTTPVVVTADIGGTSVKIGASIGGQILDAIERHDTAALDSGDPRDQLAEWIAAYIGRARLSADVLVVTVPGSIGHDFDLVLRTANVPNLQNRRLRTGLSARLGIPTLIERDVHVLLRGEVVDHAVTARHVLGIFVGTGIGAAYLADGEIFRGSGWALQLGWPPFGVRVRSALGRAPTPSRSTRRVAPSASTRRRRASLYPIFSGTLPQMRPLSLVRRAFPRLSAPYCHYCSPVSRPMCWC